jgi:Group 4 capsule polysaccharide lipoprotein gfcB, YjbF
MGKIHTHFLLFVAALGLGGCGNESVWANARQLTVLAFSGNDGAIPHTREQITSIPYATIAARFGDSIPSLMVLGYADGEQLQWVASNNNSIVTRNGRITQTVGFGEDISRVDIVGLDPLSNVPQVLSDPRSYSQHIDIFQPFPKQLVLRCEMTRGGEDSIEILDIEYQTIRLIENCESTGGWKIENTFWVDASNGFVWKSVQSPFDGQPAIEINVLKPLG